MVYVVSTLSSVVATGIKFPDGTIQTTTAINSTTGELSQVSNIRADHIYDGDVVTGSVVYGGPVDSNNRGQLVTNTHFTFDDKKNILTVTGEIIASTITNTALNVAGGVVFAGIDTYGNAGMLTDKSNFTFNATLDQLLVPNINSSGSITATNFYGTFNGKHGLTVNVTGTGLTSAKTVFDGSSDQSITIESNATSANTPATIVARDSSNNFSAGTITATLLGSATSISNFQGWSVTPNGGTLYFSYNGTNVAKLDSSGNLTVRGNITAFDTNI